MRIHPFALFFFLPLAAATLSNTACPLQHVSSVVPTNATATISTVIAIPNARVAFGFRLVDSPLEYAFCDMPISGLVQPPIAIPGTARAKALAAPTTGNLVYALANVNLATTGVLVFDTGVARSVTVHSSAACMPAGIGIAGTVAADGRYWASVSTLSGDDIILTYNASVCVQTVLTGVDALKGGVVVPQDGFAWVVDAATTLFKRVDPVSYTVTNATSHASCAVVALTPSKLTETWRTLGGDVGFIQESGPVVVGSITSAGVCTLVDLTTNGVTKLLHAAPDAVGCTWLIFENSVSQPRLGRLCGSTFTESNTATLPPVFGPTIAEAALGIVFGASDMSLGRIDAECVAATTTALAATTTGAAVTTTAAPVATTTAIANATTTAAATTATVTTAAVPSATVAAGGTPAVTDIGSVTLGGQSVGTAQLTGFPPAHPDPLMHARAAERYAPHRGLAGAIWYAAPHTSGVTGEWLLTLVRTEGSTGADSYPLVGTGLTALGPIVSDAADTDRVTLVGTTATGTVRVVTGRPAVSPNWSLLELADRNGAPHSALVTHDHTLVLGFPHTAGVVPSTVAGGVSYLTLALPGAPLPFVAVGVTATHLGAGVHVAKFLPLSATNEVFAMVLSASHESLQLVRAANGTFAGEFTQRTGRRLLQAATFCPLAVADASGTETSGIFSFVAPTGFFWVAAQQGGASPPGNLAVVDLTVPATPNCTVVLQLAVGESFEMIWLVSATNETRALVGNSTACPTGEFRLLGFTDTGAPVASTSACLTAALKSAELMVAANGDLKISFASTSGGSKVSTGEIVGIVIGSVCGAVLIGLVLWYTQKKIRLH
jgi:hypothetical protein